MYFNLSEWRRHHCEERIIQHIKAYGDIYGMTYYFSERNKRLFNNAPVITKQELKEAYANPEIIHLARTFLYRPCEEGSLDRLHDMWWGYCEQSPWKGMRPIPPNPPLNIAERFFRKLFQICPIRIAEWIYIKARHWSANVEWFFSIIKK